MRLSKAALILALITIACVSFSPAAADVAERMYVLLVPLEEAGPGAIVALDIDADGLPVLSEYYPTGGDGFAGYSHQDLAIARNGRFLYASNNVGESISGFRILDDGSLEALPGSPFSTGSLVTSLVAHPSAPYLYASLTLAGEVAGYRIDDDGALIPVGTGSVSFPIDLEVDPGGNYLYVASMFGPDPGVAGFEVSTTGDLNGPFPAPIGVDLGRPSQIEITSDSSIVYMHDLDRGISTYEVGPFGRLTVIDQNLVGGFNQPLEVSDDDRFLYIGVPFRPSIRGFGADADGVPLELVDSPFDAEYTVVDLLSPPGTSRLYQLNRELKSVLTLDIDADGRLGAIGAALQFEGKAVPNGIAYRVPTVLTVALDIKPESFRNPVRPDSRGVIPVALLGSGSFDVADVEFGSLRFGIGAAVPAHGKPHRYEDVNYDGFVDLMVHFRTADSGISCGDDEAVLQGMMVDGRQFTGGDSIETVGCGR